MKRKNTNMELKDCSADILVFLMPVSLTIMCTKNVLPPTH